jgi:hypothetical protein
MNQVEIWQYIIDVDLRGFADRRTSVDVERSGRSLHARWTERGRDRSEFFEVNRDGGIAWLKGDVHHGYSSFLADTSMADLGQYAEASRLKYGEFSSFVATNATVEDVTGDVREITASPAGLRDEVETALATFAGRTRILFVKGDAGAGKTTLLQQLTATQAESYEGEPADFLYFYVPAQGRALSNLRDAFAGELDDLRTRFRRDAVAPLARQGLLVPIIDGFDELLGTAGYSDAFSSLQSFLADLEGLGVIVVSARSSFYETEFVTRSAALAHGAYEVVPVTLRPWSDPQLSDYLQRTGGQKVADRLERLGPADRDLLRRPFFARQFGEFAREHEDAVAESDSLIDFLIDAYLARESGKFVDRNGVPLLDVEGHRRFFEETAEYMWDTGDRVLGEDELRTLAEAIAEEGNLSGAEAQQLKTKITSYAGLKVGNGAGSGKFTFDHEVYFDYFLAEAVRRKLDEGAQLSFFLGRGILTASVVARAIRQLDSPQKALERLSGVASGAVTQENQRRNAAELVAAMARSDGVADLEARYLDFVGTDLHAARFVNVAFRECNFVSSDLTAAQFESCTADATSFAAAELGHGTRLDISGLRDHSVVSSVVVDGVEVFAPIAIEEALAAFGAPAGAGGRRLTESHELGRTGKELSDLVHKVARVFRRTTLIAADGREQHLRSVYRDRQWELLLRLLTETEVVKTEIRAVSGPRRTFLRLAVSLDDLLRAETLVVLPDSPVGDFWRQVRAQDR